MFMKAVLQKAQLFYLLITLLIVGLFVSVQTASAQSLEDAELMGYAWSSNIGWISFSCRNNSTCASDGGVDYGVVVDASNRLVGHAWSSNIGWIQFGGLSGFPSTGGNGGGQARLIAGGANLLMDGWARVCAVFQSGCSGALNANAGGWDGWISLKGTTPDYRVEFGGQYNVVNPATDNANHSAWGNHILGWIDFNSTQSRVSLDLNPSIDTLIADPYVVPWGTDTNLQWTIQGVDTCTASNNRGQSDWSGSVVAGNGAHNQDVTPPYGDTVYALECVDVDRGVTVTPTPPTITVSARPDIVVNSFSLRPSSTWSPQQDGSWDDVRFLTDISGLPNGETASYRITYVNDTHSENQTLTGTVTGTGGGTAVTFSPVPVINGHKYGTSTFEIQIDLDGSGNPPGSVPENLPSTPQDEDIEGNIFTLDLFFPPQNPTVFSVDTPDDLIRYGETTVVDWEVETPYVLDCTIVGPGVNQSFTTNVPPTIPPPQDYTDSDTTPSLTSSGTYTLTCTEPVTKVSFTTTKGIEIIPRFEEI